MECHPQAGPVRRGGARGKPSGAASSCPTLDPTATSSSLVGHRAASRRLNLLARADVHDALAEQRGPRPGQGSSSLRSKTEEKRPPRRLAPRYDQSPRRRCRRRRRGALHADLDRRARASGEVGAGLGVVVPGAVVPTMRDGPKGLQRSGGHDQPRGAPLLPLTILGVALALA